MFYSFYFRSGYRKEQFIIFPQFLFLDLHFVKLILELPLKKTNIANRNNEIPVIVATGISWYKSDVCWPLLVSSAATFVDNISRINIWNKSWKRDKNEHLCGGRGHQIWQYSEMGILLFWLSTNIKNKQGNHNIVRNLRYKIQQINSQFILKIRSSF